MMQFPGHTHYGGELFWYEREFLWNTVVKHRPELILEIGTGSFGSTQYMADALIQLGHGKLFTCDPKVDGNRFLQGSPLSGVITFWRTKGRDLIKDMQDKGLVPDFLFFDGPEESEVALQDFQALQHYVQDGCVFLMHDWEDGRRCDGGESQKAALLKPYLKQQTDWTIIEEISGIAGRHPNINSKASVGMVYAVKGVNNEWLVNS